MILFCFIHIRNTSLSLQPNTSLLALQIRIGNLFSPLLSYSMQHTMLTKVWHFISYVEERLCWESIDFPVCSLAPDLKPLLQGIAQVLFPCKSYTALPLSWGILLLPYPMSMCNCCYSIKLCFSPCHIL